MPATVPLNQFFLYLREQAKSASRAREGSYDPDKGGGGYPYSPPSGFHWEQVFQGSEPVYQGAQRVYQLVGNAQ